MHRALGPAKGLPRLERVGIRGRGHLDRTPPACRRKHVDVVHRGAAAVVVQAPVAADHLADQLARRGQLLRILAHTSMLPLVIP